MIKTMITESGVGSKQRPPTAPQAQIDNRGTALLRAKIYDRVLRYRAKSTTADRAPGPNLRPRTTLWAQLYDRGLRRGHHDRATAFARSCDRDVPRISAVFICDMSFAQ